MIKNEDIFSRLFESDEKLLWEGTPDVEVPPPNQKRYFSIPLLIFAIALPSTIALLMNYLDVGGLSLLEIIIIIIVGAIIIYFLVLFSSDFLRIRPFSLDLSKIRNEMLSKTKYIISTHRILSIRETTSGLIAANNIKQLFNLLIAEIDYYFFEEVEDDSKVVTHLNFKVSHQNTDTLKNTILICQPLNDITLKEKVQIVRDEGWTCQGNEFVYRLNNIQKKSNLSEVLKTKLNLLEKTPPPNWMKKYGVIEFYNPY